MQHTIAHATGWTIEAVRRVLRGEVRCRVSHEIGVLLPPEGSHGSSKLTLQRRHLSRAWSST